MSVQLDDAFFMVTHILQITMKKNIIGSFN